MADGCQTKEKTIWQQIDLSHFQNTAATTEKQHFHNSGIYVKNFPYRAGLTVWPAYDSVLAQNQ